ncbi:Type 1 glutamine amidotransferase-like domain-containing protein [Apibacter adventoris]|uniref:Type 1 glutamine amidotransferase-like domain-containing protein n=1 Tax=Apibacter adventoris TaxID=1679466 RepID=UPI000CF6C66F|nr:Type 1 glutamine amidotransferase-like domain-containing protein [Apibacter adventoris]PQL94536.1 peptidase S51 [Apibacter adventoris]
MKRLFLSSSFADVSNIFIDFTNNNLKGKTITFIPTASIHETVNFYVKAGKQALTKMGLIVDELDISQASTKEISEKLQYNDYIYISGGNTFFLLQELQKTGADKIITQQIHSGKLYIGESAGSIILSPNIEYVKDLDDYNLAPKLQSFSALNIIDFYPLPHYTNYPFKENIEKIINKYKTDLNLYPITNLQVIEVKDNIATIK